MKAMKRYKAKTIKYTTVNHENGVLNITNSEMTQPIKFTIPPKVSKRTPMIHSKNKIIE